MAVRRYFLDYVKEVNGRYRVVLPDNSLVCLWHEFCSKFHFVTAWRGKFFSTDFDNWMTKVNSGIWYRSYARRQVNILKFWSWQCWVVTSIYIIFGQTIAPGSFSWLNHPTLHWTIYVFIKPFHSCIFGRFGATNIVCQVKPFYFTQHYLFSHTFINQSRLNHLTLHWTICVGLKPFVNVCVNCYFVQTIMEQSS